MVRGRRWEIVVALGLLMEFLVRVVDKGVAVTCSKRGDVLSACPDGWAWSPEELTNDAWRIVSVNVLQSTVEAFLSNAGFVGGRRREWMLDFSLLPDPSLFTGVRTLPIIPLTRKQCTDAAVKKP